jgi:hypothetical protein
MIWTPYSRTVSTATKRVKGDGRNEHRRTVAQATSSLFSSSRAGAVRALTNVDARRRITVVERVERGSMLRPVEGGVKGE